MPDLRSHRRPLVHQDVFRAAGRGGAWVQLGAQAAAYQEGRCPGLGLQGGCGCSDPQLRGARAYSRVRTRAVTSARTCAAA
jgi:hypothetical protein